MANFLQKYINISNINKKYNNKIVKTIRQNKSKEKKLLYT